MKLKLPIFYFSLNDLITFMYKTIKYRYLKQVTYVLNIQFCVSIVRK